MNKWMSKTPNNKTQSFIKTYSIPQYEDKQRYNEILFEDKRESIPTVDIDKIVSVKGDYEIGVEKDFN